MLQVEVHLSLKGSEGGRGVGSREAWGAWALKTWHIETR